MTLDYSKTGLPANPRWEAAAVACYDWLAQHMPMFGPARRESFIVNQPGAAARLILQSCGDWSEECITAALLGPAKSMLEDPEAQAEARRLFGDRAVDLMLAANDPSRLQGGMQADAQMERDLGRLTLAENISMMHDQLIGRARIDAHHPVRWRMLLDFEAAQRALAGRDPALDKAYAAALAQSRAALEALDGAKPNAPQPPRR